MALFRALALVPLLASTDPVSIDLSRPRDLPSLVSRWNWAGSAISLNLDNGIAYVVSTGGVTALNAGSGSVLWEHKIEQDGSFFGSNEPVLDGAFLAVAWGRKLMLLDRRTGKLHREIDLGEGRLQLAGPPVIGLRADWRSKETELVSIDSEAGAVRARRGLDSAAHNLTIEDRVVLVNLGSWPPGDASLVGFLPDNLEELWRQPLAVSVFERINGQLYARLPGPECGAEGEWLPLDPRTGQLGSPLSPREPGDSNGGFTWELQSVWTKTDETAARLRRNSPSTGRGLWNLDLPCASKAWARKGGALYLHCGTGKSRGYLFTLDWETGQLRNAAYGLRGVRSLHSSGEVLIAVTEKGIVAFSAENLGPPESSLRTPEEEVGRLLEELRTDEEGWEARDQAEGVIAELKGLGPDAFPLLTQAARQAESQSLAVIARVLGESDFRAAAPMLLRRLRESAEKPTSFFSGRMNPHVEILRALSRIASPEQGPAIGEILADADRSGEVRREALAALVTLRTPSALKAVERALARGGQRGRIAWRPPSPRPEPEMATGLTKEGFARVLEDADFDVADAIAGLVPNTRIELPHGGALLLFADSRLGGLDDLWVTELSADGTVVKPARFLGVSAGVAHRFIEEGPAEAEGSSGNRAAISARLEGAVLVIERAGPPADTLRVDLREAARDTDGDGLTDLVEKRLATDLRAADSDRDGVKDSEDPAPNVARRARLGEREEITAALFYQFFLFEKEERVRRLAAVVGGPSLELSGRSGPIIHESEEVSEGGRGENAIDRIWIRPGIVEDFEAHGTRVERGERTYTLRLERLSIPENYDIVLRRIDQRWMIRSIRSRMGWDGGYEVTRLTPVE